jgi:hypothetical protein
MARSGWRLLATAWLVATPALGAQIRAEWPDDGLLQRPGVTLHEATTTCITALEPVQPRALRDLGCRVVQASSLELADGSEALVVRYGRWVRDPQITWQDSIHVDEVVLFGLDDATATATPRWHRVGYHNFLGTVEWARHRSVDLLQVYNCVRGTGGCVEDVLLRAGARWVPAELRFIEELEPYLPEGYALHKGRAIDLASLRFEQPIATRDDPNCCPSAALVGAIRLEGTQLLLDSARFERRNGGGW